MLEAALRKNRDWCEARGSSETEKDFRGLAELLEPKPETRVAENSGSDDGPSRWLVAAQGTTSGAAPDLAVAKLDLQPAAPPGVPFRPGP